MLILHVRAVLNQVSIFNVISGVFAAHRDFSSTFSLPGILSTQLWKSTVPSESFTAHTDTYVWKKTLSARRENAARNR